jgi:hypothetical protein
MVVNTSKRKSNRFIYSVCNNRDINWCINCLPYQQEKEYVLFLWNTNKESVEVCGQKFGPTTPPPPHLRDRILSRRWCLIRRCLSRRWCLLSRSGVIRGEGSGAQPHHRSFDSSKIPCRALQPGRISATEPHHRAKFHHLSPTAPHHGQNPGYATSKLMSVT